jgi:hypothetical protein
MALFAMAIPIPPGKKEQWQKFSSELQGARRADFVESRRKAGVRERTFHQQTPMGDFVIVTLEGDEPETAFERLSRDGSPFMQWFKAQVREIHGLDMSQPPPGPPPTMVIDTGA